MEKAPLTESCRLDVFRDLTSEQLTDYRGKVLVVSGQPERVVVVADTLAEAEQMVQATAHAKTRCRFIQGPPVSNLTLADLEGR